jgi:hypothetical protein
MGTYLAVMPSSVRSEVIHAEPSLSLEPACRVELLPQDQVANGTRSWAAGANFLTR